MNILAAAIILIGMGAADSQSCSLPDPSAGTALDYSGMKGFYLEADADDLYSRYAPVFIVEAYDETYNRIGTPAARLDRKGKEDIYVDSSSPTYYTEKIEWESGATMYTNLIYRVHFEMSKGNGNSTDGGKGYNSGTMVIVTLNGEKLPILVNIVQTCGCFHALIPTTYLDQAAFPKWWDINENPVYGESLTGLLKYPGTFDASVHPVIFLRRDSHRAAEVHAATLASVKDQYELIDATMKPMDALEHLKLGDGETSFFYEDGKNQGLVKGAFKTKESILLGIVVGDTRVGQDRKYASEDEVPRGFYTSIKPGQKDESDMWDYKSFLEYNDWKL